MELEVEFLFDNQLIAVLETLIKSAKEKLILVSPFIDFDARIYDALTEKINSKDLALTVLFGKNDAGYIKSLKRNSLELLRQFPNVDIWYNERLHAKFYQNDTHYILTSMNLYDYSLANNIEAGIQVEYAAQSTIGKAFDAAGNMIKQGVDKVSHDFIGINNSKQINPVEKFQTIITTSTLIYKTEPIIVEKNGLLGMIGQHKLNGFKVVKDELSTFLKLSSQKNQSISASNNIAENFNYSTNSEHARTEAKSNQTAKNLSASQLSKKFNVASADVTKLMQQLGLVEGDKITEQGKTKSLIIKNYMGNDYIAYPEDLSEFEQLKRK